MENLKPIEHGRLISLFDVSDFTKDYCCRLIDEGKDSVEVTEFNADIQKFLKELYENGEI